MIYQIRILTDCEILVLLVKDKLDFGIIKPDSRLQITDISKTEYLINTNDIKSIKQTEMYNLLNNKN